MTDNLLGTVVGGVIALAIVDKIVDNRRPKRKKRKGESWVERELRI